MPMKISLEELQFDVSRMAICNKNTHPGYAERSLIPSKCSKGWSLCRWDNWLRGAFTINIIPIVTKGRLVGVDRDAEALEICKKRLSPYRSSLSLFNKSYDKINSILDSLEIQKVNGILLDLGLSSFQLTVKIEVFRTKLIVNLTCVLTDPRKKRIQYCKQYA